MNVTPSPPNDFEPGSDEYKAWMNTFVDNANMTALLGATAGTGDGNVEGDTETGRITVGTDLVGYLYRYLHIRLAQDINGNTLVSNPSTYTGSSIFIGTFNSASATTDVNSNFVFQEFSWASGRSAYFINTGGRVVRFITADTDPMGGAVAITSTNTTLDMETGISSGTPGDPGADAILVIVDQSNGNIFKNNAGTTTLRADVYIGGSLQDASSHNNYEYKWTYQGNTVCVSSTRQLLNASGVPLTATANVCTTGFPADSTVMTNPSSLGANLRSIIAGAEDVNETANLEIEVSNIPD